MYKLSELSRTMPAPHRAPGLFPGTITRCHFSGLQVPSLEHASSRSVRSRYQRSFKGCTVSVVLRLRYAATGDAVESPKDNPPNTNKRPLSLPTLPMTEIAASVLAHGQSSLEQSDESPQAFPSSSTTTSLLNVAVVSEKCTVKTSLDNCATSAPKSVVSPPKRIMISLVPPSNKLVAECPNLFPGMAHSYVEEVQGFESE
mmetsp:Transcript_3993/g.6247  ORF Transcript_3993/g.6247 Transcript_3993/m.6247 type:complete len:201 (-) Transcript_3993:1205-1807(-)